VSTIKRSFANQVKKLNSYSAGESDMKLLRHIQQELSASRLTPLGWLHGEANMDGWPSGSEAWLVRFNNQLFFVPSADKGSNLYNTVHESCDQLFV
jgi:hypothetical protein